MREYTFVRDSGDKIIEAKSLKKAIKNIHQKKKSMFKFYGQVRKVIKALLY